MLGKHFIFSVILIVSLKCNWVLFYLSFIKLRWLLLSPFKINNFFSNFSKRTPITRPISHVYHQLNTDKRYPRLRIFWNGHCIVWSSCRWYLVAMRRSVTKVFYGRCFWVAECSILELFDGGGIYFNLTKYITIQTSEFEVRVNLLEISFCLFLELSIGHILQRVVKDNCKHPCSFWGENK